MYKIIITNDIGQVLDQTFYQTRPNETLVKKTFIEALKAFNTTILIKVEQVKYADIGKVS